MSGAFGGYCYSDRPKIALRCKCGLALALDSEKLAGACELCLEWESKRKEAKLKACRICNQPFFAYRLDSGCCSEGCRNIAYLRDYHSERAQRWFVEGWGWLVLDVLQQVWQELYPAALVTEAPQQPMFSWNVLCNMDGKEPARKTSKLLENPPEHDNVFIYGNVDSHMVTEYEDAIELAWDRMDELCAR